MTEDCCAILDPALLTGWSAAKRSEPSTDTPLPARRSPPPSNMHLSFLIYGTMKVIQYIKPSETHCFMQITTKKGVWRGGGDVQLQVLNLFETTKKGCGGRKTRKKNNIEARHPWKRIQLDTAGIKWGFTTKKKQNKVLNMWAKVVGGGEGGGGRMLGTSEWQRPS